mgnify:CR=1 FL=1
MTAAPEPAEGDDGIERYVLRRRSSDTAARRAMRFLWRQLRERGYDSGLYRLRLAGRPPLKLIATPADPWPGERDAGQALLDGAMLLDGQRVDVERPDFWGRVAASPDLAATASGFAWLRDLASVHNDRRARALAESLIRGWLHRYRDWEHVVWAPAVTARRLQFWLLHAPLTLASDDLVYRSSVLTSMARQARHLMRVARDPDPGVARVETAAGLVLAGLLLPHGDDWRKRGEALLERALEETVLADGGVISRLPADVMQIMMLLITLRTAYEVRQESCPPDIQIRLDRMAPFLRALRHGDGGLAHMNGAGNEPDGLVPRILEASSARGKPVETARHTGLMRMTGRRSLVLLDVMPPVAGGARGAHAGALAFELSEGNIRIVVNAGEGEALGHLARMTAAHSTLVLNDTNSTVVQEPGALGRGIDRIDVARGETEAGLRLEAAHDGYVQRYRLLHRRILALTSDGDRLNGEDRLEPAPGKTPRSGLPFAIRFHLHPGVAALPTQGGSGIVLRLPNGRGWSFRTDGVATIEDTLVMIGGRPRRSLQIVIAGETRSDGASLRWQFRREAK